MNYTESVEWLFNQFPSYQNIGKKAYKPDLCNIENLIKSLNLDINNLKFVHIAGTNGKGSTSNMLASICIENGLKTGLFTSPHILEYTERIKINGIEIEKEFVTEFCNKVKHLNLDITPSFFEISFAMSLSYFSKKNTEICIIETGLGGRLDATNIIQPILSIITNIGLDHTDILGDTIEKIAFEKAGIIKNNTPVLIGEATDSTKEIFESIAKQNKSKIYFADNFNISEHIINSTSYQQKNEKTVRIASHLLSEIFPQLKDKKNVDLGVKNISLNTGFKGRIEMVSDSPLTIVDAAHNIEGLKELFKYINSKNKGNLHIIYGASSDKKIDDLKTIFPSEATYYITEFTNQRSFKLKDLQDYFGKTKLNCYFFKSIELALNHLKESVKEEDTIVITGSFFLLQDYYSKKNEN
jgi:dihydrofolate synthase/folylpolyglutamate synthase